MRAVAVMAALLALPSPSFVRTQDSDEWVRKSLRVQTRYRRVLLVDAGAAPASTVRVPVLDLNARTPAGEGRAQRVDRVFRTLQEAAAAAHGGDLVAVAPGHYA